MNKYFLVFVAASAAVSVWAGMPEVTFYTPSTVRIVRAPTGTVPKPVLNAVTS